MRHWPISLLASFGTAIFAGALSLHPHNPSAHTGIEMHTPARSNSGSIRIAPNSKRHATHVDNVLIDPHAADFAPSDDLDGFLRSIRPEDAALTVARGPFRNLLAGPKLNQATLSQLQERCAPTAPAMVFRSIVQTESGSHPLVIHVNRPYSRTYDPESADSAQHIVRTLTALGYNFDVGLAQINSQNLLALKIAPERMLDPCANLSFASRILDAGYRHALQSSLPGHSVLETAYSLYNTGRADLGFGNGYAQKVHDLTRAGLAN